MLKLGTALKGKQKVLEFLDGLLRTLKENFHELSSRTGQSGTKGRKPDTQEQDRLHSILAAAAYKSVCVHAGKGVRSPAELAQTELTKLDAKIAAIDVAIHLAVVCRIDPSIDRARIDMG